MGDNARETNNMVKRRQDSEGEEDRDHDASDSDAQPRKKQSTTGRGKASSKVKTAKKPKFDDSGDQLPSPVRGESCQSVRVLKNAEGEKYVDLGRKKRVTVRSFKGQVLVDIREFYGSEGDEKPGKKGISLSMEQWEVFKQCISTIDSFFAEQGKT